MGMSLFKISNKECSIIKKSPFIHPLIYGVYVSTCIRIPDDDMSR